VRIKIEKSPADSFQVGVIKMSNGRTRRYADTLASLIKFNISQNDSLLFVDRAIAINTTNKFRNQSVDVIIYVPVGHHIKINKSLGYSNYIRVNGPWNHDEWYNWDENDFYYKYGEEYIMKEDGLYTLNGIPAAKEDDWHADDENGENQVPNADQHNYRYDQREKADSLKSIKDKQIQKIQESVDSLKSEKDRQIKKMKDSLQNVREKAEQKTEIPGEKNIPPAEAYIQSGNEGYNFVMHI
jgi:hypothetical protein